MVNNLPTMITYLLYSYSLSYSYLYFSHKVTNLLDDKVTNLLDDKWPKYAKLKLEVFLIASYIS